MSDREKAELAEQNMSLVWYVVNQYIGASVKWDELYSAALLGMARALSAYDETKGIKFSTFAVTCMNHEILNLLKDARKHRFDISFDYYTTSQDDGSEIRYESFVSVMTMKSTVPEDIDTKIVVRDFVEQLSERNKEILWLSMNGMLQKDIAERMGVSRSRIEQILLKMRANLLNELYSK